ERLVRHPLQAKSGRIRCLVQVQVGSDAELAREREDGGDRGLGIRVESRHRAEEVGTRLDGGDEAAPAVVVGRVAELRSEGDNLDVKGAGELGPRGENA